MDSWIIVVSDMDITLTDSFRQHPPATPFTRTIGHARHVGQRFAAGAEFVEEDLQGGHVSAGGSPHQPAGVVVDHTRQIPMPLSVGDRVDTAPTQPV